MWLILQYVVNTLLILCFLIWLKFHIRRVRYSNYFPCIKHGIFDIKGDLKFNPQNELCKIYPPDVVSYHMMEGYAKLFMEEGLYAYWMGYSVYITLIKPDAVEKLISGTRNLEKAWDYTMLHPWLGTGLLTSHGGKWKARRKLLTPSFHFDILTEFVPIMNEQSEILIKILRKETEKAWIDVVGPITLCSLDIICETTLGVHIGAQESKHSEYVQAVTRAVESIFLRMVNPLLWTDITFRLTKRGRQFQRDLTLLHNFTRKVIQEKKQKFLNGGDLNAKKKRKAFMDLLLEHHITNNTLTEEDIREEVDTFTFEGHDTTSMGICWTLYLIGLYEDVQAAMQDELSTIFGGDTDRPITADDIKEMKYLERVLKESQRLYPSVPFVGRHVTEELIIRGYKIPKGTVCACDIPRLHRDPEYFPDPEKFDPDRFLPENSADRHPFAYIPFSAGPRNCIGQRFAMMELKVVIANILRHYNLKSIDQRDKIFIAPELIQRPAHALRIKFSNRS